MEVAGFSTGTEGEDTEVRAREEVTMGDRGLATEAVEEEPSLLLARELAALGSYQSGYSLTLGSYSDNDLNVTETHTDKAFYN